MDSVYKGVFFQQLALDLSNHTSEKMLAYLEQHPTRGTIACPFVCLALIVTKLVLRLLSLVEFLFTPVVCAVLAKKNQKKDVKDKFEFIQKHHNAGYGVKKMPSNARINFLCLLKYTAHDLARQGIGMIIGLIKPKRIYKKMHYQFLVIFLQQRNCLDFY